MAEKLADVIWFVVNRWPEFAKTTIGRQLTRAPDSIGANIAEGSGRGSYQDNRRFVKIARGSLCETQHWLRRAFKRNLLSQDDTNQLKPLVDELAPRLNAYLNSIGPKAAEQSQDEVSFVGPRSDCENNGQLTTDN